MLRTDNIDAIFMSENASTGVRTRFINTRYHFIREYVEDVFIKIVLLRQKEKIQTCELRMSIRIPTIDMW
jgi:hypothetical protein